MVASLPLIRNVSCRVKKITVASPTLNCPHSQAPSRQAPPPSSPTPHLRTIHDNRTALTPVSGGRRLEVVVWKTPARFATLARYAPSQVHSWSHESTTVDS
jgi:hypothetical protein